jgi:hypothetical protein
MEALLMFKIYQHGKKSDYRLIIPEGANLPSEAKEENWKLTKTVEKLRWKQRKTSKAAGIICTSPLQLSKKSRAHSYLRVSIKKKQR